MKFTPRRGVAHFLLYLCDWSLELRRWAIASIDGAMWNSVSARSAATLILHSNFQLRDPVKCKPQAEQVHKSKHTYQDIGIDMRWWTVCEGYLDRYTPLTCTQTEINRMKLMTAVRQCTPKYYRNEHCEKQ
jgi:hypothetical protein